uniref:Capsid protein n=1 Tax=Riboviria sp. TaxID=2585031 RepID=A0A8B0RPZ9_9VIRU|nr:hypothetical protein 3 [Riboviria sp.]
MVMNKATKRGPKQAVKPRKQRVKQRRRGGTTDAPAIVNTGATVRSQAKKTMRMTGSDRLAGLTFKASTSPGTILYERFIDAQMFPSLSERARTFQRIKYTKLVFKLVSESGTNVTGGIAAAFFKDAYSDVVDGDQGLTNLMTQAGAKATKAWQELVISTNSPEHFYVTPGSDLRLFSPGKFVVMTSGPVDKDSPLSLYCDWTVELSKPGRNAPQKQVEQPVVTCSYILSGVNSQDKLQGRNWDPSTDTESTPQNPEDMFRCLGNVENTDFTSPKFYRLPHPMSIDQTTDQDDHYVLVVRFLQLALEEGKLIGRLCHLPFSRANEYKWATAVDIVLMQGDILEPINPLEFAGNGLGEFFVSARSSTFAPGRSYISKSISRMRSTQSGATSTGLEAIFKKFTLQ